MSAVMEYDWFLVLMKPFYFIPIMPSYKVSDVRPIRASGRPAIAGFIRSYARSSSGNTLYFSASVRKRAAVP
jgi:hypothetical protein